MVCSPCRHGYLNALPAREYLPVFWSEEELELLEGTEAEGQPHADRYGGVAAVGSQVLFLIHVPTCTRPVLAESWLGDPCLCEGFGLSESRCLLL